LGPAVPGTDRRRGTVPQFVDNKHNRAEHSAAGTSAGYQSVMVDTVLGVLACSLVIFLSHWG
jgi:hypothetical protein